MKYCKIEDNKFCGFYDGEIHKDILFNITTVKSLSTEESKEVLELKEGYLEITDERWLELLNGQCEGKEIRMLKNGELGLYQVPHLEEEMLKPSFDYDKEMWIEQASDEELLQHYESKLVEVQKDIKLREELGLMPSKEQLALKSKYMNSHINICHTIALK